MRKIYYSFIFTLFACLLLPLSEIKAQDAKSTNNKGSHSSTGKVNWTKCPFDYQIFIENNGQYDGKIKSGDKILFAARSGLAFAYFTRKGIVYRYDEFVDKDGKTIYQSGKQKEEHEKGEREVIKDNTYYLSATWEGCNPNVTLTKDERLTGYYTFPTKEKEGDKSWGFKKITYHNLYPGIDAEYSFIPGKEGIKYTLIIHPGANLSVVKLAYDGAQKLKIDSKGNLKVECKWGTLTEHVPQSHYEESQNNAEVNYAIINNTEEVFNLTGNPLPENTLVIDPWSTLWTKNNPINAANKGAYDLDFDYNGNVYVYGGNYPFQLVKLSSSGTILWTYATANFQYPYYGDFAVEKTSGSCFACEGFGALTGAQTDKINNAGVMTTTFTATSSSDEDWRMDYDLCDHEIIIAGGGTFDDNQATILDTNLANSTYVNVLGFPNSTFQYCYHDMYGIAIDDEGGYCYMAPAQTASNSSLDNNVLIKMPMPTLTPTIYNVPNGLDFQEVFSIAYVATGIGNANGMNCMTANSDYVFMYDGIHLREFNAGTGAFNLSATLPGTSSYDWGGIDVDLCNNVYLGNQTNVLVYNSSLTQTGTIGPFPGNVYDVVLGNGLLAASDSILYVSGQGFISSVKIDQGIPTITKSRTGSCTCNATATGTLNFCGSPDTTNVTYSWSDGQTTHTAINLCPGSTYTLTIKVGCAEQFQDTFNIPSSVIVSPSDTICLGGSTPLTVSGGTTYTWAPATGLSCTTCANPVASPTVTTVYTVTSGGGGSCVSTVTVTVLSQQPVITASASPDTLCNNNSTILTASGGATYSWAPAAGLVCSTCDTTTASPTATTTYTVTGTNRCFSSTAKVTVDVETPPVINVTASKPSICSGESVTLQASASNVVPPFTWLPTPMTGQVITITPSVTTTYTVTGSNACGTASASTTISVNSTPVTALGADNTAGCSPLCIQFRDHSTITQGSIASWTWNFGNGDTLHAENPIYCYPKPGLYSVTLTTVSDSGCSSTLDIANYINVYTHPVAGFAASPQPTTILQPTIQFTDNSTDNYGITYWTWNFGETGDTLSNLENPSHVYHDTGTYCPSLVVTNNQGCTDTVTHCIVINPIFTLYIPNAFTPNGQGGNNMFAPKGNDITSFEMYIFDRWGQQLFHSTDINDGWNGTIQGSSTVCQEDTYVYVITATDSNKHKHTYMGTVTLLK